MSNSQTAVAIDALDSWFRTASAISSLAVVLVLFVPLSVILGVLSACVGMAGIATKEIAASWRAGRA